MIQIFYRRLQQWLAWLWEQEGTPGQRARGIAAGIFSGCFPLFGLQTLLGITIAKIIRGNYLLAAAGTWVSNPATYLPLYWLNYQIGSFVLGHWQSNPNLNPTNLNQFWEQGWTFSIRLLIGSTLTGSISSLIIGAIIYFSLKKQSSTK